LGHLFFRGFSFMVQHDGQAGSGPVNSRYLAGTPASNTSPKHGPATSSGNIKGHDASSNGEHQTSPSLGSRDPSMDGQDRILQDAGNFKSMSSMGSGGGNIGKIKGGKMVSSRKSLTPVGFDGEEAIRMREQEEVVRAASAGQMDQRLSWLENRTRMAMGMSVVDAIKRCDFQSFTSDPASSHRVPALRTVCLMCETCIFPSFSVPSFPSLSSCPVLLYEPLPCQRQWRFPAAAVLFLFLFLFLFFFCLSSHAFTYLPMAPTPIRLEQALHECGGGCDMRQLPRL
jgi:hypothetical protein